MIIRYKSTHLFLALVSFFAGVGASFIGDGLRALACNSECMAQLLYKNSVFFELRGSVSVMKKDPTTKVVIDQSRYTPEFLRKSGIGHLVVMNSGEFVVTSRVGQLAMLAKPTFEGGRLSWRCQFFGDADGLPTERACSY